MHTFRERINISMEVLYLTKKKIYFHNISKMYNAIKKKKLLKCIIYKKIVRRPQREVEL